MGAVYKAEDEKLKRTVALKFLTTAQVGDDDHKARFLHEARAAAALDHPNIRGIYEIDEVSGRLFMAMPLLEGDSLDKRIAEGPRPLREIAEIAIQTLAFALVAAPGPDHKAADRIAVARAGFSGGVAND